MSVVTGMFLVLLLTTVVHYWNKTAPQIYLVSHEILSSYRAFSVCEPL